MSLLGFLIPKSWILYGLLFAGAIMLIWGIRLDAFRDAVIKIEREMENEDREKANDIRAGVRKLRSDGLQSGYNKHYRD